MQQNGAMTHTSRNSMNVLRENFPGRSISRYGDIPWPARSSDLTSCDYFYGATLRLRCINIDQGLEALKDVMRFEVGHIPQQKLCRVVHNFRNRLQRCINNEGHHLVYCLKSDKINFQLYFTDTKKKFYHFLYFLQS